MAEKPGDAPDLEAHDALETQQQQQRSRPTLAERWRQPVDIKYADLICLLLCLNTGLCDSSAYNAWSCFLAMQTGK